MTFSCARAFWRYLSTCLPSSWSLCSSRFCSRWACSSSSRARSRLRPFWTSRRTSSRRRFSSALFPFSSRYLSKQRASFDASSELLRLSRPWGSCPLRCTSATVRSSSSTCALSRPFSFLRSWTCRRRVTISSPAFFRAAARRLNSLASCTDSSWLSRNSPDSCRRLAARAGMALISSLKMEAGAVPMPTEGAPLTPPRGHTRTSTSREVEAPGASSRRRSAMKERCSGSSLEASTAASTAAKPSSSPRSGAPGSAPMSKSSSERLDRALRLARQRSPNCPHEGLRPWPDSGVRKYWGPCVVLRSCDCRNVARSMRWS
mmetsp:Transcript_68145/g.146954  ORF Transcript_68145/g.146954 Transcript_68145/m.146954 type:complete len:318 (+) Transcript_68145:485-1438(+)